MIQTKRSGKRPHTDEELQWWIAEYTLGKVPDYQMSAWLMAVCWQGMTPKETAMLTKCMIESGAQVSWDDSATATNDSSPSTTKLLADKHSTGGVGDKISLVLAPLAACLGIQVPMMAGRGLGHTGGTIDKLESIPGYQTSLSMDAFQKQVRSSLGCSIVSANQELCPADRKLYALRDVTATVSSVPLITASIMSKKIAENPQVLVLDTKYGRAAFRESREEAEVLAHSMIATGEGNGVKTTAFLTRMDHPIGRTIGNWLEVYECILMMKTGTGDKQLMTLVVIQAAEMIRLQYPDMSWDELVSKTLKMLQSGQVYKKFRDMVQAQGGDVQVVDECQPNVAKFSCDIVAPQDGYIADMDALAMGLAGVKLGAGRTETDHPVDANAGIQLHRSVGDSCTKGEAIATVYTNQSQTILDQVTNNLEDAISYTDHPVEIPPVVSHRVCKDGAVEVFEIPSILREL